MEPYKPEWRDNIINSLWKESTFDKALGALISDTHGQKTWKSYYGGKPPSPSAQLFVKPFAAGKGFAFTPNGAWVGNEDAIRIALAKWVEHWNNQHSAGDHLAVTVYDPPTDAKNEIQSLDVGEIGLAGYYIFTMLFPDVALPPTMREADGKTVDNTSPVAKEAARKVWEQVANLATPPGAAPPSPEPLVAAAAASSGPSAPPPPPSIHMKFLPQRAEAIAQYNTFVQQADMAVKTLEAKFHKGIADGAINTIEAKSNEIAILKNSDSAAFASFHGVGLADANTYNTQEAELDGILSQLGVLVQRIHAAERAQAVPSPLPSAGSGGGDDNGDDEFTTASSVPPDPNASAAAATGDNDDGDASSVGTKRSDSGESTRTVWNYTGSAMKSGIRALGSLLSRFTKSPDLTEEEKKTLASFVAMRQRRIDEAASNQKAQIDASRRQLAGIQRVLANPSAKTEKLGQAVEYLYNELVEFDSDITDLKKTTPPKTDKQAEETLRKQDQVLNALAVDVRTTKEHIEKLRNAFSRIATAEASPPPPPPSASASVVPPQPPPLAPGYMALLKQGARSIAASALASVFSSSSSAKPTPLPQPVQPTHERDRDAKVLALMAALSV